MTEVKRYHPFYFNIRSREQLRFDTNRIVAILKEHEKIMVDGFDQNRICRMKLRKHSLLPSANDRNASSPSTLLNTTTTLAPVPVPLSTTQIPKLSTSSKLITTTPTTQTLVGTPPKKQTFESPEQDLSNTNDNDTTTSTVAPLELHLEFKNDEMLSDISQAAQVKNCEDLLKAGHLDNKVYTVDVPDIQNGKIGGHDFRHRLCDQQTSGGGWTVNFEMFRPHYFCLFTIHVFMLSNYNDYIIL